MAPSKIPQGRLARLQSLVSGPVQRRVAKWGVILEQVNAFEPSMKKADGNELRKQSLSLRYRAKSGEPLAKLIPEAYALVREAGRRTMELRHFDVQIVGGISLFFSSIAEMQTGEGKTLTATLPLYLHSLTGKGAHLATVNDYLAARDADWMRPIYEQLGLTVGVVQTSDSSDQRREAYGCDVTYGTAKEFGFDFLRDRLLLRGLGFRQEDFLGGEVSEHRLEGDGDRPVQRGSHFVLIDEADSILIDEARTPLIIGSLGADPVEQVVATYEWAAQAAGHFEEFEHYDVDDDTKKVELNAVGRQLMRALSKPDILSDVGLIDLYEYTERAIKVARDFHLDRQYVVRDGEIVIVDEFTGRLAEGRKWRDGIHQALEAKEAIEVTVPTGQAARITIQDLFLRYHHLAGMTGTAATSARELLKIYKTRVIPVPTNRPPMRERLRDRVFATCDEKYQAIVDEVREMHTFGRPVLIGTRSIDKSEIISKLLETLGLDHEVLNANELEREAEIVSHAGEHGKITVATNMAGRGTDIKLGENIAAVGGLHVICTELHDAARIDRQLVGRCGRQGDPGSFRQYLSLDDDILRSGFGPETADRVNEKLTNGQNLDGFAKLLRRAQRKVEKNHFRDRMMLMHHEKERKKVQREMGQDPYLDTPD